MLDSEFIWFARRSGALVTAIALFVITAAARAETAESGTVSFSPDPILDRIIDESLSSRPELLKA
jgi:hypothetical protein